MGVRSLIRDILTLYVCFIVFGNLISGNMKVDTTFILATILLFLLTIWFLLEKIGLIPKIFE
jgi:hypothetical protein